MENVSDSLSKAEGDKQERKPYGFRLRIFLTDDCSMKLISDAGTGPRNGV